MTIQQLTKELLLMKKQYATMYNAVQGLSSQVMRLDRDVRAVAETGCPLRGGRKRRDQTWTATGTTHRTTTRSAHFRGRKSGRWPPPAACGALSIVWREGMTEGVVAAPPSTTCFRMPGPPAEALSVCRVAHPKPDYMLVNCSRNRLLCRSARLRSASEPS